jgi:L-lactate dehydrogenase complex protein LldG
MSRAKILAKVACALHAAPEPTRGLAVEARLAEPLRAPALARTRVSKADLAALFKSYLSAQGVDLIELDAASDIPAAIARYLSACGLPVRLRSGRNPYFEQLPWASVPALTYKTGPARPDDIAGLSLALAGVAETGTLVLASGPRDPVTLAFVPDAHVVVVSRATIVGSYEDACALIEGPLPRTINLISGPSRTGDIGGRIVMGAHGPRRLAVLIVGAG